MTQLSDVINVSINISTLRPSFPGQGIPVIVDQFASFPTGDVSRYRRYISVNDATFISDWPTTSKVYKAAQALFSGVRAPAYFYVGRKDNADGSWTVALNAIRTVLVDFYALITTERIKANIQLIAAWAETNGIIYGVSSEEAAVVTSVITDIASLLQASGYNRTFYSWHSRGGIDLTTGASAAVVSGTAPNFLVTVTMAAHGLRVGDITTVAGAATKTQINGDFPVATVIDANTFTYNVTSFTLTTGTEAAALTLYARYDFLEAAWIGNILPTLPGQYSWNFTNLPGQLPDSLTFLTEAQELITLGKNANVYTALGGVGGMRVGTMASGRFIDIETSVDWLQSNLQQAVYLALISTPKIPYTDAGMAIIQNAIESVLKQATNNGILGPLLPPVSLTGAPYLVIIPKVATQTSANRLNRIVTGITIQGQMAGAVNKVLITMNASF